MGIEASRSVCRTLHNFGLVSYRVSDLVSSLGEMVDVVRHLGWAVKIIVTTQIQNENNLNIFIEVLSDLCKSVFMCAVQNRCIYFVQIRKFLPCVQIWFSLTILASFQTWLNRFEIILIAGAARINKWETCASSIIKVITANIICIISTTTYFGRHEASFYTCGK